MFTIYPLPAGVQMFSVMKGFRGNSCCSGTGKRIARKSLSYADGLFAQVASATELVGGHESFLILGRQLQVPSAGVPTWLRLESVLDGCCICAHAPEKRGRDPCGMP